MPTIPDHNYFDPFLSEEIIQCFNINDLNELIGVKNKSPIHQKAFGLLYLILTDEKQKKPITLQLTMNYFKSGDDILEKMRNFKITHLASWNI